MCAGSIAYILYQSSRYLDQGGSLSKAGNRRANPRVGAVMSSQDEDEEVEMQGKLLTEEEILAQIKKVKEKERRKADP